MAEPTSMELQNFFFDLDGTIINSEPGLLCAHTSSLEQLGYLNSLKILAEEGLSWTIGPPLGLTVPRLIGSEDKNKVDEYISTFQKTYQEIYYKDFLIYDGVDELLRKLNDQGKRIFICTSKPEPIARKVMECLNYDAMLCDLIDAHLDERPHQKSDLLQELCQKHIAANPNKALLLAIDRMI